MKKMSLSLGLTAMIMMSLSHASAQEALSGNCGPDGEHAADCHWELIENGTIDGTSGGTTAYQLVISGSGAMKEYVTEATPWHDYIGVISSAVLEGADTSKGTSGVTSLGYGALFGAGNLKSLTLGDSVQKLSAWSVYGAGQLTELNIGNSLTTISNVALSRTGLTTVNLPDSLTYILPEAFAGSPITSLTIPDSVTMIGRNAFALTDSSGYNIPNDNITDLRISASKLALYLEAKGGLAQNATLTCTVGDCVSVLSQWDYDHETSYLQRARIVHEQADGSKVVYQNGKIHYEGKRIYSIQEANSVTGKKNTVMIRYK